MSRLLQFRAEDGDHVRLEAVAPAIFRVRKAATADFNEPGLVRYGVLRKDWPDVAVTIQQTAEDHCIGTEAAAISVAVADGRVSLHRADGDDLTRNISAPACGSRRGFAVDFALRDDERLYGLGDVTRDRIQKRGDRSRIWVKNVTSYVPVPYLMSNRGWAILVNSTWKHFFDVGAEQPDRVTIGGVGPELDYYLFVGHDMPALLDRYTDLSGKPVLLPMWAYGLTYVCHLEATARDMMDDALNFRRENIPCDLIGLEPGWMDKHYDYSTDKKWNPQRFHIPYWRTRGPDTFFGALERLGFKLSLWLCTDYDYSHHEERQLAPAPAAATATTTGDEPADDAILFNEDDFEQDVRANQRIYIDKVTKRNEPWFEHLKKFVDQGAAAFKLDGSLQVNENPDRCWGNGMNDLEMHNLKPVLLNKQMHLGFRAHTQRRPMIYSSGGFTGIQRYAATWAGDTGGGPKPLVSLLNHSLTGHANTSVDMDVFSPAGIHFGFLQPWSQLNNWAYWRQPWFLDDRHKAMFRDYARLRYRLLPYLYSMAHVAHRTGLPILRAMPLMFPDDPRSDGLLQQYMLGDAFLVAAFTEDIHLPPGRWADYWTGRRYEGPIDLHHQPPQDRGGGLFVREGAIIPTWPDMAYVGEKSIESIGLQVYPGPASQFTLYEDDGLSHDYEQGRVATSTFRCQASGDTIELTIGPRQGVYEGMPSTRRLNLALMTTTRPRVVQVDGRQCAATDWDFDEAAGAVTLTVNETAKVVLEGLTSG